MAFGDRCRRFLLRVGGAAGFVWVLAGGEDGIPVPGGGAFPAAPPRRELRLAGRFVFERHCIVCHGPRGNGRGEFAASTWPRPRDFTRGLFKYRSTPSGTLPTDADLERTIRSGLTGTAMPAFTQLADREVEAVIEYVKTFSPRWTNSVPRAQPIEVPSAPVDVFAGSGRAGRVERGRGLFGSSCVPCHGEDGGGSGPSAAGLVDAWEQACAPRDLRAPVLRGGSDAESIYRTLSTGMDGSPMPSFGESMTAEQRWDLVAYVLELRDRAAR